MEIIYSPKTTAFFAQAYGTGSYNGETYSCLPGDQSCIDGTPTNPPNPTNPGTPTTETAPNTGFLGMSQDAAVASLGGALLIAIAIAGAIYVISSRIRSRNKKGQK